MDNRFIQDPLLAQYVNEKLLEKLVETHFIVKDSNIEPPKLTIDQVNALRYAAGYVP